MSESEDFAEVYRGRRWITDAGQLAECVLSTLDDLRARRRVSEPRGHNDRRSEPPAEKG